MFILLKQKNIKKIYFTKKKGFTLVETLIAISIFSVSIVTLMSILGGGISNINYAKTKVSASYLAQEGIEYIRNMRDNYVLYPDETGLNWDTFKVDVITRTYPSPDSNFNRTIQVTTIPSNPNELKISSTVSWLQGSGSYSITFSENLFNWVE